MAAIILYQYPASVESQQWGVGSSSDIDDPWDGNDGWATRYGLDAANNGTTYRKAFASFGLGSPQTGISINWIRVHAWLAIASAGGYWLAEPVIICGVRPGSSATYYDSASRTIADAGGRATGSGSYAVTTLPSYNFNTASWLGGSTGFAHVYWDFPVNPASGLTWTVSNLQALLVSVWADSLKGSPGAGTDLPPGAEGTAFGVYVTSLYVEVNANQAAAGIEEKRLAASAYLRLFRNGVEPVSLVLPLRAATVDIGDVISMAHPLAPAPDGLGWGVHPWERHYGMVLGKTVDPSGKRVTLEVLDLYRFFCGLWFPAITDLPYTEEGQGIPYLDAGGGRSFTRYATNAGNAKTKGYVRVQEKDVLYVEAPQDKEKWSPDGLAVFRESYAAIANDSFSQGSGTTFTGWTNSVGGTGYILAESTSKFLFDVAGLRRCLSISAATGGGGSYAGVYQTTGSLATSYLRVHVIAERWGGSTAANLFWRFVRASDGWYWNDSTAAWQSGLVSNPLTTMAVGEAKDTRSKLIPSASVSTTYTLYVYAEGTTSDAMYVYYANLWWGATKTGGVSSSGVDMERPPFVTTTAAAYEGQDILTTANPATARSWDPTRGTGLMTLKTAWAAADMETGSPSGAVPSKTRVLALSYLDASNYDVMLYYEDSQDISHLVLKRRLGDADYVVSVNLTGADRPSTGSVMKIAWRWQARDGELGLGDFAAAVFCSTDGRAPLKGVGTIAEWNPGMTTIYLGNGWSSQPDGWIRDVEIVPLVLPDEEIYRRLRV